MTMTTNLKKTPGVALRGFRFVNIWSTDFSLPIGIIAYANQVCNIPESFYLINEKSIVAQLLLLICSEMRAICLELV